MLKKYSLVKQDDLKDCGVSALLSIIRYYGGGVSKEYLRTLTLTTKDGVTAYHLINAGKTLGFDAYGIKGNIFDLKQELMPLIAHVIINKSYKHFVVIYKISKKKKKIIVGDPSSGIKSYTFDEWNKISTNNYLIFKPIKKIPIIKSKKTFQEIIINIIKSYYKVFLSIFILSIIYMFLNIITSFYFKILVDNILIYNTNANLNIIGLIMLILVFIKALTDLFRDNLINYINHQFDRTLIKDIYRHIISLPYLYYRNRTTGEIISRIDDLSSVRDAISNFIVAASIDIILIVFVLITLFKINVHLTLIALLITILYFLVISIFNPILKKRIIKSRESLGDVNTHLIETISGIETIKGLSYEEGAKEKLEAKFNKFSSNNYKFIALYHKEKFFKELISLSGLAIILLIGAKLVIDEKLSLGNLITYQSLLIYFLEPVKNIINMELIFSTSKVAVKRIIELYDIDSEKLKLDHKYSNKSIHGNITINNLEYTYNYKDKILKNINLKIKQGDKVMLFGESGSGKSTFVKLLLRYLEDYQGNIYLDNKELKDYNLMELRNNICYISQTERLFTDSIYNNIVLDRDISYDEFLKINKLAIVDEIVNKNNRGYDFLLEENGFNLSGGERQRIILARALLKKSNLYIIDEGLNQLDISRERKILKNLFKEYKDKTIIVISHRFNNLDLFNKKYKLEDGCLNEC